jgi:hypothetical protein
MHPPIEVLAVLIQEGGDGKSDGNEKLQRAHIDELLGGKATVGTD